MDIVPHNGNGKSRWFFPAIVGIAGILIGSLIQPMISDRLSVEGKMSAVNAELLHIRVTLHEIKVEVKDTQKEVQTLGRDVVDLKARVARTGR